MQYFLPPYVFVSLFLFAINFLVPILLLIFAFLRFKIINYFLFLFWFNLLTPFCKKTTKNHQHFPLSALWRMCLCMWEREKERWTVFFSLFHMYSNIYTSIDECVTTSIPILSLSIYIIFNIRTDCNDRKYNDDDDDNDEGDDELYSFSFISVATTGTN